VPPGTTVPPGTVDPSASAVTIESDPAGADVLLDGALLGRTPALVPRPASGEREVTIRLRGYQDTRVMVLPTTGATLPVTLARASGGHTSMATTMETAMEQPVIDTVMTTETTMMGGSSEVVDPWDM
jgi:hypothetical protein